MTSDDTGADAGFAELISRYEKWRRIYSYAGKPVRDELIWGDGRLNLRYGYPHMDWTAYVIEPKDNGYNVLRVTTERRNEPHERLVGFFSHLDDAGKYVIWYVGESLRMYCSLPPLTPSWRAAGLDPRVKQISLDKYVSKYEFRDDPSRYFVPQVGGVQPENRLLPLTYDELDAQLLDGMPESVTSRL
ncbi:hypothetical protein [Mycobacterium shimoidei]|uniref:Uncharacterized protein n=1 Tax=Mycobacterium shimoidei TaxID=29313 RepID=A0A375Z5M0_MYCSH|nr:hypothetical protein [Mycobacterium shimoidei]MCV7257084.1 hypothetical protein [Mycobacterium shimoidei]SSA20658.1 hypothetical protein MSP7336_04690 [Mycobacterium shimoidei]